VGRSLIGLAVGSDASYPWARSKTTRQAEQVARRGENLRRECRWKEWVLVGVETKPRDAKIALEGPGRATGPKGEESMVILVDETVGLDQCIECNNRDQDMIVVRWDWIWDYASINMMGNFMESCHAEQGSRKSGRAVGYATSSLLVTVDIGSRSAFAMVCLRDLLSRSNLYGKATTGRVVGTKSKQWPEEHCCICQGTRGAEVRDVDGSKQ